MIKFIIRKLQGIVDLLSDVCEYLIFCRQFVIIVFTPIIIFVDLLLSIGDFLKHYSTKADSHIIIHISYAFQNK